MGKSEASSTPQAGLGVYASAIEAIPPVAASSERPFFRKVLSALRIFAINLVIFAVLAELASLIYINVTKWPGSKPSYHVGYNDFSADINPAFGAWHRPKWPFHPQIRLLQCHLRYKQLWRAGCGANHALIRAEDDRLEIR